MIKEPILEVKIGKLTMKNPVMTASGTFGYGEEFSSFIDLNQLGAMALKGITLNPKPGNMPPRVIETSSGMLNAIGLQNVGIDCLIKEKLPRLQKFDTPSIINISGETIDEFTEIIQKLNVSSHTMKIGAIEVNISCPNIKNGGMLWGTNTELTYRLIKQLRKETLLPLIVKLSPNVTDIKKIALAAEEAGADAISLINTLAGMAIDRDSFRPKLTNVSGGLSGPAIKPVALWLVWQVCQTVKIPVIGLGGIMRPEDAIDFFIAGATAVQVGTANLVNPHASIEIIEGVRKYLFDKQIENVNELVGTLKV